MNALQICAAQSREQNVEQRKSMNQGTTEINEPYVMIRL